MNIIFGSKEYDKDELKIDLRTLIKNVKEGNLKKVKKVLSSKKGKYLLNVPDELDQTCLMVAARSNNLEMFETVLSFFKICKVDLNLPDKNGYTVVHHLFSMTDLDAQALLLLLATPDLQIDTTNRDLNTPFHYFCQKFRSSSAVKEVFDRLVALKVNVNAMNRNGESPIHKAIFNNALAPTMLGLLLENGANVNVPNKNGETGLHYCVRMGRTDLVTLLLKYGADKNVTKDNKTLYDIAMEENFTKLADLLKDGVTNNDKNNGSATELLTLLQNPTLREDFRAFLRDDLICEENISFWSDIESYRHLKVDTAQRLFKELYRIYDKYIPEEAPSEINVPFSIKKEIITFVKTLPSLADIEQQHQLPQIGSLSIAIPSPSSSSSSNPTTPSNSFTTGFSSVPILDLSSSNNSQSSTINHHHNNNNTNNNHNNHNQINNNNNNTNDNNNISSSTTTPTSSPILTVVPSSSSSSSSSSLSTLNTPSTSTTSMVPITGVSPNSSASSLSPPPSPPVYDFQKLQSIYNGAQQHVFMLMATDSLTKYKKRTRKSQKV